MEVILKLLVNDRPGVLDRIAGLIRRKGLNISSINAGDIDRGLTQINMALMGQMVDARELCEHLAELDFLRSWEECTTETHVLREMLVFCVGNGLRALAEGEGMQILSEQAGQLFVQYTGTPSQVSGLLESHRADMTTCSRSGPLVLAKDPQGGQRP